MNCPKILSFVVALLLANSTTAAERFTLEHQGITYSGPADGKESLEKLISVLPNLDKLLSKELVNNKLNTAYSKQVTKSLMPIILMTTLFENPDSYDPSTGNINAHPKKDKISYEFKNVNELRKKAPAARSTLKYINFWTQDEYGNGEPKTGLTIKDQRIFFNYNFNPKNLESMNTLNVPIRVDSKALNKIGIQQLVEEVKSSYTNSILAYLTELVTITPDSILIDATSFVDDYFKENSILIADDFTRQALAKTCTLPGVSSANPKHKQKFLEAYAYTLDFSKIEAFKNAIDEFDISREFGSHHSESKALNAYRDFIMMKTFQTTFVEVSKSTNANIAIAKLAKVFQKLKSAHPINWTTEQFFEQYNKTFSTNLQEKFKIEAKSNLAIQLRLELRKRGIFTDDDPIKVQPRITMTVYPGKSKIEMPKGFSEKQIKNIQRKILKITQDYANRKEVIIPDAKKDNIKNITDLLGLPAIKTEELMSHEALEGMTALFDKLFTKAFYNEYGGMNFQIWIKDDLKKRLKAGQQIQFFTYNKETDKGSFNLKLKLVDSDSNSEQLPVCFPLVLENANEIDSKIEQLNEVVNMLFNKIAEALPQASIMFDVAEYKVYAELIIASQIISPESTESKWFQSGLANYLANESYKNKHGAKELNTLLRKVYKDVNIEQLKAKVNLANWQSDEKDLKDLQKVQLYYATKCFDKIVQKHGGDFIKKWVSTIKKDDPKTVTMQDVYQSYEQLTGDSLKELVNNITKI